MKAIDTRTEAERASLEALLRQGPGWTVQGGEVYSGSGIGPFLSWARFNPYEDLTLAMTIANVMGATVVLTVGDRTVVHVHTFSRPPRAGMALSKQSAIRFWGINQPHPVSVNATLATMLTECMLEMLGIK